MLQKPCIDATLTDRRLEHSHGSSHVQKREDLDDLFKAPHSTAMLILDISVPLHFLEEG